ncbi:ATP-binding protein [Paenibacillus sp. N1-5-1-14]|uniref:AAA family ATPase n=1 Tax=Paenibacillus radicibacter TaxID=2972488 RepID=UPI002158A44C|nr:ATP-binding protein [Paenibacillus radicibacter]MCR8644486.1 ATP-binding protein [Paenibacillus radicibacter]
MFFVQMSGFPGSGKSTLSKRISQATGAIVVDHDIMKTALMNSLDSVSAEIDAGQAGRISYDIEWSLIDYYLSSGFSVILDSPCLYPEMVEKGEYLATKNNVKYKYVECYLNDVDIISARLKSRIRMRSQIEEVRSIEGFNRAVNGSAKPKEHTYIVVDSSNPLDTYLEKVMKYVRE